MTIVSDALKDRKALKIFADKLGMQIVITERLYNLFRCSSHAAGPGLVAIY